MLKLLQLLLVQGHGPLMAACRNKAAYLDLCLIFLRLRCIQEARKHGQCQGSDAAQSSAISKVSAPTFKRRIRFFLHLARMFAVSRTEQERAIEGLAPVITRRTQPVQSPRVLRCLSCSLCVPWCFVLRLSRLCCAGLRS